MHGHSTAPIDRITASKVPCNVEMWWVSMTLWRLLMQGGDCDGRVVTLSDLKEAGDRN